MEKRSYKITFALQEGYAPGAKIHTRSFAAQVIHDWMTTRLQAHQPVVSGFMQEGMLLAPGVGRQPLITTVPTCLFTGELSSDEDNSRTDQEVRETLESLAKALKQALKQESVYIIYLEDNWCI
ncbi:MAG: hypothetical protein ACTHJ8_10970 [Mucilaginibacter sp.]